LRWSIPSGHHAADLQAVSVTKVDAKGLSFTTKTADGSTNTGDLKGPCIPAFHQGGGGSSCSSA
jgi:hypothetical protein